jgi:hypothetical protein
LKAIVATISLSPLTAMAKIVAKIKIFIFRNILNCIDGRAVKEIVYFSEKYFRKKFAAWVKI